MNVWLKNRLELAHEPYQPLPPLHSTMPSLLDSPPPPLPAIGAWSSLYATQELVKPPRHVLAVLAIAAKKLAYAGRKTNLEMCTEALRCEIDYVDATAIDKEEAEAMEGGRMEEAVDERGGCGWRTYGVAEEDRTAVRRMRGTRGGVDGGRRRGGRGELGRETGDGSIGSSGLGGMG